MNHTKLDDAAFKVLLNQRSRLRWTLTGTLVAIYIVYGLAGLSFREAYGLSFMGSAMSWGLVCGFMIMALSVAFSLYYVRISNRLDLSGIRQESKPNE